MNACAITSVTQFTDKKKHAEGVRKITSLADRNSIRRDQYEHAGHSRLYSKCPPDRKGYCQLNALANAYRETFGITQAEEKYLTDYTSTAFVGINWMLRSRVGKLIAPQYWWRSIKNIQSVLQKMPNFRGRFYRRINIPSHQVDTFVAELKTSGVFSDPAFMSTSADRTVARDGYSGNVTFEIDGISAKQVQVFSHVPSEQEFIFLPNTRFRVKSIEITPYARSKEYTVRLEEIAEPLPREASVPLVLDLYDEHLPGK